MVNHQVPFPLTLNIAKCCYSFLRGLLIFGVLDVVVYLQLINVEFCKVKGALLLRAFEFNKART